jgi:cob(I)alamin adenosyltransferase
MTRQKLGLIHVYTGEGKGKTTSAMGLVLRAIGQGLRVYIIQFLKGGSYSGEFVSIKNFLPNVTIKQYGKPCIKEQKQMTILDYGEKIKGSGGFFIRPDIDCGSCRFCFLNDKQQQKLSERAFKKATKVLESGDYDVVVLDELNYAINLEFIKIEKVIKLLKSKGENVEVIITGRDAPKEITEIADYVTKIEDIKHPFMKGILARRGIEY